MSNHVAVVDPFSVLKDHCDVIDYKIVDVFISVFNSYIQNKPREYFNPCNDTLEVSFKLPDDIRFNTPTIRTALELITVAGWNLVGYDISDIRKNNRVQLHIKDYARVFYEKYTYNWLNRYIEVSLGNGYYKFVTDPAPYPIDSDLLLNVATELKQSYWFEYELLPGNRVSVTRLSHAE